MKTFKVWIEDRESNTKDTVLQILGLDTDGLETPLKSLDVNSLAQKLSSLGMWKTLPADTQEMLTNIISNGVGTVGQLIDKMNSKSDTFDTSSVMPPADEI